MAVAFQNNLAHCTEQYTLTAAAFILYSKCRIFVRCKQQLPKILNKICSAALFNGDIWENFNVERSHFYDEERLFLGFCVLLFCICLPADLCYDSQCSCDLVSDVCSPTLMKYWYSCCLELEQGFTSAFTKKYTIKTLY